MGLHAEGAHADGIGSLLLRQLRTSADLEDAARYVHHPGWAGTGYLGSLIGRKDWLKVAEQAEVQDSHDKQKQHVSGQGQIKRTFVHQGCDL